MTASDAKPVRVVFTPSGLVGAVPPGTTVLGAARQLGVDLDSVCAGRGLCGRCQVEPSYGAFPKWGVDVAPGALGPPAALERAYRGARPLVAGRRLGCTTAILGASNQVLILERSGIEVAYSEHVYFTTDESAVRAIGRAAVAVLQPTAVETITGIRP